MTRVSESKNKAEFAMVGDSEKRGLESEKLESTTDSESTPHAASLESPADSRLVR